MSKEIKGFIEFIREKGVVGLAIGFLLGGAITKLVTSLVTDIINPILGLVLGVVGNLDDQFLVIGKSKIAWGSFVNNVINFLIIAFVVYYGVKLLRVLHPEKSSKN